MHGTTITTWLLQGWSTEVLGGLRSVAWARIAQGDLLCCVPDVLAWVAEQQDLEILVQTVADHNTT